MVYIESLQVSPREDTSLLQDWQTLTPREFYSLHDTYHDNYTKLGLFVSAMGLEQGDGSLFQTFLEQEK